MSTGRPESKNLCLKRLVLTSKRERGAKEKWLHQWVNVENEGGQPRTTKKSPKKAGDEVKGVKYNKVFESLRKDMSSCSLLRLE